MKLTILLLVESRELYIYRKTHRKYETRSPRWFLPSISTSSNILFILISPGAIGPRNRILIKIYPLIRRSKRREPILICTSIIPFRKYASVTNYKFPLHIFAHSYFQNWAKIRFQLLSLILNFQYKFLKSYTYILFLPLFPIIYCNKLHILKNQ